jgi:hypothetical protein
MAALAQLGLYPGSPDDVARSDQFNPAGYWEHRRFVKLDDAILAAYNLHRYDMRSLPDNWRDHPRASELLSMMRSAIEESFYGRGLWGWKDPRATLILPIVRQAFVDLKLRSRFLLAVRHPIDVAQSMNSRETGISVPSALGMWLHYTLTALHDLPCADTYIVFYRDLVDDPRAALTPVLADMDCQFPSEEQWNSMQRAVRRELSHSRTAVAHLEAVEPRILTRTFTLARAIREHLDDYRAGRYREEIEELWDRWKTWEEIRSFSPPVANSMTFSWQLPNGTRRRVGGNYFGDSKWTCMEQSLDAPPNTQVGLHFGSYPGVIYLRNIRLVAEDGRIDSEFDFLRGYDGQVIDQGGGMARVVFCGPAPHTGFKMPNSPGVWSFKAEYFADLSVAAAEEATTAITGELVQWARSASMATR